MILNFSSLVFLQSQVYALSFLHEDVFRPAWNSPHHNGICRWVLCLARSS